MKLTHCKVWIDLGEGWAHWPAGEAEYTAWFDYSPGRPGRNYMPNGDPGYPDDPPELYVLYLERDGHKTTELTYEQLEPIERQVGDWIIEQEESAQAARAERDYE